MQVQIFVEPVARHEALAAAMNAWLAANPRAKLEEHEVRIFHNHTTNADDVLVMLFYEEAKARREGKKSEER